MTRLLPRLTLSLLAAAALQLMLTSCSSEMPISPASAATIQESRTAENSNQGQGGSTTNHDVAFDAGYMIEEVAPALETQFTGLIVGIQADDNIIRLMNMDGFQQWVCHVTDQTVMEGLQGEAVTLADFGVCSGAEVRGEEIGPFELNINFLKMKNF